MGEGGRGGREGGEGGRGGRGGREREREGGGGWGEGGREGGMTVVHIVIGMFNSNPMIRLTHGSNNTGGGYT